ncbi:MAG: branched-chain amino acid transaminase [Actinobacteria bacterium]|nr:branched-chain amino acid transaminase [Actinomycetota bacterium]
MSHPKYAFFNGEIRPIEQAKIDIRTNALQYGTAVFEGIRSYWNENTKENYVFRLSEHYRRLVNNSRIMMIEIKYSIGELARITLDLLKMEDYTEDSYIRPFAYNSGLDIGPKLVGNPQDIFIYSIPLGDYIDTTNPISVCVSSWVRTQDNAIPPRAKLSGSYINAALQKTEALLNGYQEAITLTSGGCHVSEGSAMNIFMVKNGVLVTPPITDDILEGITRDTVIELAHKIEGLKVIERSIDRTELYTADELFFCGTGAQISPIGSVDKRKIGNGEMGAVTRKMQELYFKVVKNEVEEYSYWCTKV